MKVYTFYDHLHQIFHLISCNAVMFLLSDFAHLYAGPKFFFNNGMFLSLDHESPAHYM